MLVYLVYKLICLSKAITMLMGPPAKATLGVPIDGIFVSGKLLPVAKGGYLAFEAGGPSDHQALWIDLPGVVLGLGKLVTRMPKSSA